ncbi:transcriptional regulator [Aminobacter sp. Y103A]|uniref:winged helix-turn-helix transcriptional regulator n=1 Tax=Aminobacter sp. Y103A TaxID=1870862 RepID=UPI0025727A7C|nr:helix-turn-helix domain-containing protein [Aminobacter sp. SS-2016]WMC95468.1 helix-turn-helix domain-containing protein [Aminobacter aminovorans]BBD39028.1 transcriptional regulator [Aminobacter sp. SS-2016]
MRTEKSRSYDDGCATAHALDLIGERWALLVVRELLFGPKRFTDLRTDLRTISPNVLTQRLEALEATGIVRRRKLPPPAASWIYELTEWGSELEDTIVTLGKWAARSPFLEQGLPISRAGLLLAMRAMYRPQDDGGFCISLDMPDGTAVVSGTAEGFDIQFGDEALKSAQAMFSGTSSVLDSILFGGVSVEAAVKAGDARITGDMSAMAKLLRAFPMPPAAPGLAP